MSNALKERKDDDSLRSKMLEIVVPDYPSRRVSVTTSLFNKVIRDLNSGGSYMADAAKLLMLILNDIASQDKALIVKELERALVANPTQFIQNNRLLVQSIIIKFSDLQD